MTLLEIRQAYDKNYQELLTVIHQMGGEGNIPHHRVRKTGLFLKLRKLQRTEHQLSILEETLSGNT